LDSKEQTTIPALGKYTFGTGDRFGREGDAQMRAIQAINRKGLPFSPVWNKSNREHQLTGTTQESVRQEADRAVEKAGWTGPYFVDADHITLDNVDGFTDHSDFFTLDAAAFIGKTPETSVRTDFIRRMRNLRDPFLASPEVEFQAERFADTYLAAIGEIIRLYDHIKSIKPDGFIAEVSMDEVPAAQGTGDLYVILRELRIHGIEPHTIAPRFSGIFAKGIDFAGDIQIFRRELEGHIRALQAARNLLDYRHDIKISLHSGSDKFSLYPIIREVINRYDAGIHIKTAGTTWLEEVIGLASAGGEGLRLAKEIYIRGLSRYDEMAAPYLAVLHIDPQRLPPAKEVLGWKGSRFKETLEHNQECRHYNPDFRQLVHISYKVAAEMRGEFTDALEYYRDPVEEQVYQNLYDRHFSRLL
jgi:hypothetical protein